MIEDETYEIKFGMVTETVFGAQRQVIWAYAELGSSHRQHRMGMQLVASSAPEQSRCFAGTTSLVHRSSTAVHRHSQEDHRRIRRMAGG
jgi:hypothetical protein